MDSATSESGHIWLGMNKNRLVGRTYWQLAGWTRAAFGYAWRRVGPDAWPLVQQAAAGTTAWVVAEHVAGHADPFFAPIAAVVALNAAPGERGPNALQLLAGVLVGIAVGELALVGVGSGYASVALSLLGALAVARAFGGTRLVVGQAAASAVLTVAVANGQGGPYRIVDALIGAGIALVFSQVLFAPEPVALLHHAESTALAGMVNWLRATAGALRRNEWWSGDQGTVELRELRDRLSELSRARRASMLVPRYTLAWRLRIRHSAQEGRRAGDLEMLGASCLTLARTAVAASEHEREMLAPCVDDIATVLHGLAHDPYGQATRRHAADQTLRVIAGITGLDVGVSGRDTMAALRMVATDVLVFAGVERRRAQAAVREDSQELEISAPPTPPGLPGISRLRTWRSHRRPSRGPR